MTMESMFNYVWQNLLKFPDTFLSIYSRGFIGYIAFAFLIGAVVYYMNHRHQKWSIKQILAYLFPAEVYKHRAFRMDMKVMLFNYVLSPVRLVTAVASIAGVAWLTNDLLGGAITEPVFSTPPWWGQALIGFALFALYELAQYTSHYMHHKIDWLWAFHAIHHEPEHMNPLTLFRHHPVEEFLKSLITAIIVGVPAGVLITLIDGDVYKYYLLFASVFYKGIFSLMGSSLQHTHIWLSWGYPFNHILISPAQHQCHHSVAARHIDTNFGGCLAIWDALFGTLYCPEGKEEITFGVKNRKSHGSLIGLLVEPVVTSGNIIARKWTARREKRRHGATSEKTAS